MLPAKIAGSKSSFSGYKGFLAFLSTLRNKISDIAPIIKGITNPIILSGNLPLLVIAIKKEPLLLP